MPWKSINGSIEMSGPIVTWVKCFEEWYRKDTASNPQSIDFNTYAGTLFFFMAACAKEKWSHEWLGGNKIDKLNNFVSTEPGDLRIKQNLYDIFDFFAENLKDSDRHEFEDKCRKLAREIFQLDTKMRPGYTQIKVSGPALNWFNDFEEWYKEEIRERPSKTEFTAYLYMLVCAYVMYAKMNWKKYNEEQKIQVIDSLFPSGSPGNPGFDALHTPVNEGFMEALNIIANDFPDDFRIFYSKYSRDFARQIL